LRRGLRSDASLEVQLMARYASTTFTGIAKEDHKIRSSIYSTAALALDPWLEPSVAHSATASDRPFYWSDHHWEKAPQFINLDWLVNTPPGRSNTLYLAASQPEFERLSPVLGGLLADLKDSIHAGDIAGNRLKRPLLFVIDEAGQLELGWLPAEVSTIAALGAFFVTCWQSLSQMQHRYTSLADAVLSGHRTKCFFAGVDDLATTRYLSTLLGSEHVTRRSWSHDVPSAFGNNRNGGRRSVSVSQQREEFAPANALRQMYPGEAVLLHGTLPPIHLDAVRWWKEPHLANLVPLTADGDPQAPNGLITCPLTNRPSSGGDNPIDTATLDSALAQLPEPTPAPTATNAAPTKAVKAKPDGQQQLFSNASTGVAVADPPAKRPITARPTVERYSGRCAICQQPLGSGEGQRDVRDGESIVRCAPSCTERKRLRRQTDQR
jgi:type IV secretory pathway TraG/TraD family ATPase VirD4